MSLSLACFCPRRLKTRVQSVNSRQLSFSRIRGREGGGGGRETAATPVRDSCLYSPSHPILLLRPNTVLCSPYHLSIFLPSLPPLLLLPTTILSPLFLSTYLPTSFSPPLPSAVPFLLPSSLPPSSLPPSTLPPNLLPLL